MLEIKNINVRYENCRTHYSNLQKNKCCLKKCSKMTNTIKSSEDPNSSKSI